MNNFVKRTLFGAVYLVVLVGGIIWDRVTFVALFLFVLLAALREFYKISYGEQFIIQQKLGVITALTAFLTVSYSVLWTVSASIVALTLIPLGLLFISLRISVPNEDIKNIGGIFMGLLYIAAPISLSSFMVVGRDGFYDYDGWLLLSLFILIWVTDVGAYCLGTLFGQKPDSKKLAPSISPKKSWWGFWSGIAFAMAASVGLHYLTWLPYNIWHCLALGLIISVGGICGDLIESMWKRCYGVKDSGNIIPGHGGILDRFDSSLVAIPLAGAYLALMGLL